jgi:hypothetical protein
MLIFRDSVVNGVRKSQIIEYRQLVAWKRLYRRDSAILSQAGHRERVSLPSKESTTSHKMKLAVTVCDATGINLTTQI